MGEYTSYNSGKRQRKAHREQENVRSSSHKLTHFPPGIPIPGSYPTDPPASYSNMAPLPPLEPFINEDEELGEVERPWISTPLYPGQFVPPPTIDEAKQALANLKLILWPPCNSGRGGHKNPKLDQLLQSHLEKMSMFLWNYIDMSGVPSGWMCASLKTAKAFQKGLWLAGRLRQWTQAFVKNQDDLLYH
jgi:hypothetical protein